MDCVSHRILFASHGVAEYLQDASPIGHFQVRPLANWIGGVSGEQFQSFCALRFRELDCETIPRILRPFRAAMTVPSRSVSRVAAGASDSQLCSRARTHF